MLLSSLFSWNHVHPVLVHFTTALLPVSLVSDGVGKFTDRYSLTPAAWWMLLYGAIATPLTALAGWMWATDIGDAAGKTLSTHEWLGLGLVFGFLSLAIWRGTTFFGGKKPGNFYFLFAAVVTAALCIRDTLAVK